VSFSLVFSLVGLVDHRKDQSGDGVLVDFEHPLPDPPFMQRPSPHIAAQGASEIRIGARPTADSQPQFNAMPLPIKVAATANITRLRVSQCGQPRATGASDTPVLLCEISVISFFPFDLG
jgi:hypothetical protein